jgi:hypothetical protein
LLRRNREDARKARPEGEQDEAGIHVRHRVFLIVPNASYVAAARRAFLAGQRAGR